MQLSENPTKNKILITCVVLLGAIILIVVILILAGCFNSKSKKSDSPILNTTDYQMAIKERAENFDFLQSKYIDSQKNFEFFTLESLKKAYPNNIFGFDPMFVFLACNQHCDHIVTTEYDPKTQIISAKLHEFLLKIMNNIDVVRASTIFFEIFENIINSLQSDDIDDGSSFVQFLGPLLQKLQDEEKLTPRKNQYFLEDAQKAERRSSDAQSDQLQIINSVNLGAADTVKPIDILFGEQRAACEISEARKIHKKVVFPIYGKYLMISITGPKFDKEEKNIGKKTLLSELIVIDGLVYLPKLVVCHLRKIELGSEGGGYQFLLFTSNGCLTLYDLKQEKITTQKAFEIAFERGIAFLYERMD